MQEDQEMHLHLVCDNWWFLLTMKSLKGLIHSPKGEKRKRVSLVFSWPMKEAELEKNPTTCFLLLYVLEVYPTGSW